jgi:glyoxylase-like metal-dependent hydrolase (beta-lactamase superfamily II)
MIKETPATSTTTVTAPVAPISKPMNEQEKLLAYPCGDTLPAIGSTMEVASGVRWLRMLLPFALDHINLWLLRDYMDTPDGRIEGWSIVDCGIANDATRAAWEQVFATELQGLPVLRVIVTHMHPDHMGLSNWLTERWSTPTFDCRLWISATDYNVARLASELTAGHGGNATADFMARHGLTDEESQEKIRARTSYYANLVPKVPPRYRRLLDGMGLHINGQPWTCHVGYGHAPEHMSLHGESQAVVISGDMVLPRISTNISVMDLEPEADPLKLYLDSLNRMRTIPADTLVLPSHGRPFRGLHTRIAQLETHHADRFAEVMQACAQAPQSAADLLMVLFKRKLDLHQTTFAMGEAIAHLHALWYAGKLVRRVDAQGVFRFTCA